MTFWPFLWLTLGFIFLVGGAEVLVRGASRLALLAGISPLVVGLTVVSYATSAPELAVSIEAAIVEPQEPEIALGNVLGSNVANILFVLGASALVMPLAISKSLLRFSFPLMIGVSIATFLAAWTGEISRGFGGLLVFGAVAYTGISVWQGRRDESIRRAAEEELPDIATVKGRGRAILALTSVFYCAAGLAALIVGARWLVDGASTVARAFEISELTIGLTVVAFGTSLPEAATSIVATIRGERDIAVGNVVGSNLFNLLAVLGTTALVSKTGLEVSRDAFEFDFPISIAVALACVPAFYAMRSLSRATGAIFVAFYVGYVAYLYVTSGAAPERDAYAPMMIFSIGVIVAASLAAFGERLVQKARLADE